MGIRTGRATRHYTNRVEFITKVAGISLEAQYMLPILSSEHNSETYSEMINEWTFIELDEYKMLLDILSRSKLASTLDNMPSDK